MVKLTLVAAREESRKNLPLHYGRHRNYGDGKADSRQGISILWQETDNSTWTCWYLPVIPATQETESGISEVQSQPGQLCLKTETGNVA